MENLETVDPVETALKTVKNNGIQHDKKRKKKRFAVNKKLLPLKIHYFLLASASSAVLPFLPIFASSRGVDNAALRLLQIVAPLLAALIRPLVGAIVDRLQILKQFLMLLLIFRTICCLCILFVPTPAEGGIQISSIFYCDSDEWQAPTPSNFLECTQNFVNNATISCTSSCAVCALYRPNSNITGLLPEFLLSGKFNTTTVICNQKAKFRRMNLSLLEEGAVVYIVDDSKPICSKKLIYNCTLNCSCLHPQGHDKEQYFTVQFWMFLALQLLLYAFTVAMNTISDTASHQMIPADSFIYGKQRLWYTLGWTSFLLFTMYLLNLFNTGKGYDFSIGFYITVSLMFLDFAVVCAIDVDQVRPTESFIEHLIRLVSSTRTVLFMVSILYIGIVSSVVSSYYFGYLLDMKQNDKLAGAVIGVSSLSEIIGFYFSGKIIAKIGHFLTLCLSLLGYSIRYFIYYFKQNSWFVLIADLAQGVTFSITLSSVTTYSKSVASAGTETTTQAIIGGMFTALGWGVGQAIGEVSNNRYGVQRTFLLTGVAALCGCCILLTIHTVLRYFENERKKTVERTLSRNPAYESDGN